MTSQQGAGRESRHLWVGGLPDNITEVGIKEYFSKFGKIEGVKILPQKYPNIGVAAFIDFFDVQSAIDARDAKHKLGGNDLRTNFKAKATEKFDANKKKVSDLAEKISKDRQQIQGSSSSSSSESDTDDSSSSSGTSSDHHSNGKKMEKIESEISTLFLKITGLANRPERVLQDGLYYEFCRYSPHAVVRMYGDVPEKRSAIVKYNRIESCREAYTHSQGMVLFGSKLKLVPLEIDEFPSGGRDQPFVSHVHYSPIGDIDPQATRSLFVGNIPKNISVYELRDIFQRFGNVLDVEIKKMGGSATYGFVLYYDLLHAVNAKQCMDGQNVKGNNIRVGFGKGTPSKTLWIDGIDPHVTEAQLERQVIKYGKIVRLGIDRPRCCAMVQYDNADSAKDALNSLKGSFIGNSKRLMTDFANRDARAAFFSRVDEGEGKAPVHQFPGPLGVFGPGMVSRRGGILMPRGGIQMMGIGRGGYPLNSPPCDYFFNPYMEESMEFYGGGRPPFHHGIGPINMRRYSPQGPGGFSQGMDDYEEELRAFSRKREWEREREKHKEGQSITSPSASEDEKCEKSASQRRKRQKDKRKKLGRKMKVKDTSPVETEDDVDKESGKMRELARQKATQRAKEHREKNKKKVTKDSDNDCGVSPKDKHREQRTMQVLDNIEKMQDNLGNKVTEVRTIQNDDIGNVTFEVMVDSIQPNPVLTDEDNKAMCETISTTEEMPSPLSEDIVKVSVGAQLTTLDSPQSPVIVKKKYERVKVESDLSSDEEFLNNIDNTKEEIIQLNEPDSGGEQHTTSGPRTPETEQDHPCSKYSMSGGDSDAKSSRHEYSKRLRLLPRRYQVEEMEIEKREGYKLREHKDPSRVDKRHCPTPTSPSSHSHQRKHHHSPPLECVEKRWYHRDRPPSPGVYPVRRFSRSPQGYSSPSPRHYSTSPPPPRKRSRSPIPQARCRDRGPPRHRYDSPPFEAGRGKHSRRGTSPLHRRYPYTPSPPTRPRSPVGRRYGWRRSPSLSPPRQSSAHIRREKSPLSSRVSPHYSTDNYPDASKRYGKRPVYSRTPSPKPKHRESGKEEIPETKRRKVVEEHRPKSPSPPSTPQPLKGGKSVKSGQQQTWCRQAPDHKKSMSLLKSTDVASDHSSPETQCFQVRSTQQTQSVAPQPLNNLLDLLRRYPVIWQGHLTLKNDLAAVQLHFLSGNAELAKMSLPPGSDQITPTLRIAQRMRLEKSQLDGVERRIQNEIDHCLLLALPCGKDANDVHVQTQNLKNSLISYLIQKQAAGIINVQGPQGSSGYVLHIFPPCPFTQSHLSRVAPDLSSASDNCHLMIVAAIV